MTRRLRHRRASRRAVVAALVLAAGSVGVDAGIIRHDRSDNVYRGIGFSHDDTGWILAGLSLGSGTLISPRWVLTAGHVVDGSTPSFNIGGSTTSSTTSYPSASFFPHPNWNANAILAGFDIGLIKLQGNGVTGIKPASRFTGHDEVGRTGTSLGFGLFGEGDDPARTLDGRRRGGMNVIDAAGVDAYGPGTHPDILAADFDDPGNADGRNFLGGSNLPLEVEYCVASGDSGGGMFVDQTVGAVTRAYVAGVHSFVEAPDPPNGDNIDDSSYSDTYGSTRVSAFNSWIDDQITNKWTNAAGGSFGTAGNWSPAAVPDQYDVVGFNTAGTYTINFAATASVTNNRVIARNGVVTLNLNGGTYTLTSQTFEGSLIVGRYAGNVSGLTITNGVLTTRETVLGEQVGSTGQLTIGNAGTWNVVGDVYAGGSFLGGGGTGAVVLNSGSSTTLTGNLKLYGGGSLNLVGGSFTAAGIEQAGGTIAAFSSVTLSTPVNSTGGGTLRADAAFTMSGAITTAAGVTLTKTGPAALTISGAQTHGANTTLLVSAGTLNLNSNAGGGGVGNLAVTANATTNFGSSQNLRALTVANNVTATVTAGANKTIMTDALSVVSNGKLDLKDNALVVNYTGATVEPQVFARLASGHNAGTWNGPGIMSSTAGGSGVFALGYGEANDLLGLLSPGATATWRGQTVDGSSVLVRYTYGGDANLDGLISGDDYAAIDFNVAVPGAHGYWRGDFNYDGIISGDDYATIDFNIVAQGAPLGAGASIEGVAAVPEPSSAAWLAVAAISVAARRRRAALRVRDDA